MDGLVFTGALVLVVLVPVVLAVALLVVVRGAVAAVDRLAMSLAALVGDE